MFRVICILLILLLQVTSAFGAYTFNVCGFPSTSTTPFYVQVVDITDLNTPVTSVANTSTGVVARTQQTKYCVYYSFSPTAGHTYEARFKDSTATPLEATDILSAYQTYVDAAVSSRSTYAGGAVASVSSAVTCGTVSDKTGYTVSTVSDKTGYTATCSTVSDKTGYTLSPFQSFTTTGAVGSVVGAVGSVTGNVSGNVTGSVGSLSATAQTNVGNAVWDTVRANHTGAGSFGQGVSSVQGNVTGSVGSVTTVSDKTGYSLTQAFPTNFSSLSISAGGGVIASTIGDKSGYSLAVTPPTAIQIRQELDTNSTKLVNLDVSVSSRSTFAGGAVASVTGNVGGTVNGLTTTAKTDVENAVWNATSASHNTSGTTGFKLNSAASASDPWSADISTYASGTAGYRVYTNLDTLVSSRPTLAQIEGSNILLRKTTASPTNLVTVGSDNKVAATATATVDPTAVGNAVWDAVLSGHTTAGTTGAALTTASSGSLVMSTPEKQALAQIIWEYTPRGLTDKGGFSLTPKYDACTIYGGH